MRREHGKLAGLILAAGESSRMGADKALLDYHGSTFLEGLVSLFLRHVSPVVVVLGHHAEEIGNSLPARLGLEIAVNTNYKAGQLSSLQAGIKALAPDVTGALLTLVDHPAVEDSTIATMIEVFFASDVPIVVPRYRGRRGHPVLLSRALLVEIAALPPTASAKQVIHAHLDAALQLDVDDPGVLRDIDTPADFQDLRAAAANERA